MTHPTHWQYKGALEDVREVEDYAANHKSYWGDPSFLTVERAAKIANALALLLEAALEATPEPEEEPYEPWKEGGPT